MRYTELLAEARLLGGFQVKPLEIQGQEPEPEVDEAIALNAPQRRISRDELQGYADRIKTGTKTKQDRFSPIIHGSNIKAITTDNGEEWDLDDLARQITTRPRAILGTNAKMEKSANEGEIVYDLTLPALSGIVVDEENGDFVEITTCPGAGECQLFCYARKGGYVMFPASSMSAAQALNFLVNDPDGYMARVNTEIQTIKGQIGKASAKAAKQSGNAAQPIQLVVRWHDAGDFFSKEYLDLAYSIATSNPDIKFYAYTKMGDVATGAKPANFIVNFSSGAKRAQDKKIEIHKAAGNPVKQGLTLPKDMFRGLFVTDAKGKYVKDEKGRTQVVSTEAWEQFKQNLAAKYKIDPDTIITYDQMLTVPEGPQPKWNVVIFPAGHGDRAANRLDVENSFLMFH
jgi:Gene product 88